MNWFKHGLMVDAMKVYILILVCVTLILIQGHRGAKKKKKKKAETAVLLSDKVCNGFGWDCFCC